MEGLNADVSRKLVILVILSVTVSTQLVPSYHHRSTSASAPIFPNQFVFIVYITNIPNIQVVHSKLKSVKES